MTPEQASNLQPGDRVHFHGRPDMGGEIVRVSTHIRWIRWDSGTLVPYTIGAITHLDLDPQGLRNREEPRTAQHKRTK
jgi:hypothetical protein